MNFFPHVSDYTSWFPHNYVKTVVLPFVLILINKSFSLKLNVFSNTMYLKKSIPKPPTLNPLLTKFTLVCIGSKSLVPPPGHIITDQQAVIVWPANFVANRKT